MRACYQEGLWAQPDLAGVLRVRFVINGRGQVTTAKVTGSTLDDAAVQPCIVQARLGSRSPKLGEGAS